VVKVFETTCKFVGTLGGFTVYDFFFNNIPKRTMAEIYPLSKGLVIINSLNPESPG